MRRVSSQLPDRRAAACLEAIFHGPKTPLVPFLEKLPPLPKAGRGRGRKREKKKRERNRWDSSRFCGEEGGGGESSTSSFSSPSLSFFHAPKPKMNAATTGCLREEEEGEKMGVTRRRRRGNIGRRRPPRTSHCRGSRGENKGIYVGDSRITRTRRGEKFRFCSFTLRN